MIWKVSREVAYELAALQLQGNNNSLVSYFIHKINIENYFSFWNR